MIGALWRALDRFHGSGDAAVTIPSMDGAFRPNHRLEMASSVLKIDAPDNLAYDGRRILFTSGSTVFELRREASPRAERIMDYQHPITALDVHPSGAIALGLANGEIVLAGGAFEGRRLTAFENWPIRCPTALRFADVDTLVVCLGSQQNDPFLWTRDLLDGARSGSVWRVALHNGTATCLAQDLAWPNGVINTRRSDIIVAEAWRHQLVEVSTAKPRSLLTEIPGYPARLAPAGNNGFWLAIFAPRSQLVEFVLREPRYRQRMMAEVDPEFWVAPSLHPPLDYREPLQAGAIKQLGELKPWAPSRSYGLVARLDADCNPIDSLHSRADGRRHGITSCVEVDTRLLASSKGGNLIVALDLADQVEQAA
jgi:hypothetical protein